MIDVSKYITTICKDIFDVDVAPEVSRTPEQFGDYATNIALRLAGTLKENPLTIAEKIANALRDAPDTVVSEVTVAPPGFINMRVHDAALVQAVLQGAPKLLDGHHVLLEYSCPNAFKELHTGHLYQTIIGDSLGRLMEKVGAHVYRANFGGDVGLHVAKCLWGICEALGGEKPQQLITIPTNDRTAWISRAYVSGAKAYEDDETAAQTIKELNTKIYDFHVQNDHTSPLARIYWTCREWSYDYFRAFYDRLEVTPFDKYYPESATMPSGVDLVKKHTGDVFTRSDGAVVFSGESRGLHTRVFITSKGLPTYETKDLGVIMNESKDYPAYDRRIILTGKDQTEYMKVVFAALSEIDHTLSLKQTHLTNGIVRFSDGKKMSSRLGNVLRAVEVLDAVSSSVAAHDVTTRQQIALGAIKYAFLKQRLGGDIAFDVQESVTLEGNSGPYLQYAYVRARGILRKINGQQRKIQQDTVFSQGERSLLRKLSEYPEVLQKAVEELMPHYVCTYLYELSQEFNRFYEGNRVIDDERESVRASLVGVYASTLQDGLQTLGVDTPEKM